jgi:flagellar biosynthesis protein FlhF
MKIRIFNGTTMQTAMADVRAALGPDAVILSNRRLKSGEFEVQAAVETVRRPHSDAHKEAEAIAREADLEQRLRQDLLGVMRTETLRSKSAKQAGRFPPPQRFDEGIPLETIPHEVRDDGWVRTGTLGIVARRIRAPGAIPPDPRLKAAREATIANPARRGGAGARDGEDPGCDLERIKRALDFHAVPRLLCSDLLKSARAMASEDAVSALAHALDLRFTLDPIPALPRRPVMLVGPPGAGKTVTVAKLAARAVLLGRGVDIISTDTLRAGAKEQMQSFTSILKEELVCVSSSGELEAHLRDLRAREPKRPCVIDTPGTNPFSRSELRDLRKFVRALDVEPVLVVAAGGEPAEQSDMAQIFATLGVQRLIATRIDAARRLGSILAAADAAKLSLAQFSMTPYIGRGLSTMNPMSLARLLLGEPGAHTASNPSEPDTPEPQR